MDIRAWRGYFLAFSPVAHKLLIQRHRGRVTKEKQSLDHGLVVETRELAERSSTIVLRYFLPASTISNKEFDLHGEHSPPESEKEREREREKRNEMQPGKALDSRFARNCSIRSDVAERVEVERG